MTGEAGSFDVIVVGAGSAGCVLAERLSEDAGRSVLLLEAGPDFPDVASMPAEVLDARVPIFSHDWGFYSEPGALGRSMHLPRGKLTGGCSATNAAIALRGLPADYDGWSALGNDGWSWADVLPFFRKLEADVDFDDAWHGRGGPLPIRRFPPAEYSAITGAFIEACVAAGHARVPDHNAPDNTGVGPGPFNAVAGVRQSTALTYLGWARGRSNLTIRTGATADRIVFDGRRATGVRLIGGEVVLGDVVVLSAGAYASPAILMRSGIGPADELRAMGIDVLEHAPGVGNGLTDHPLVELRFAAPKAVADEVAPFCQALLTLCSSRATTGHDLQVLSRAVWPSDIASGADAALYVSLLRPLSRGRVRLRSADVADALSIDPGHLTDPADVPPLVEAVREARRIAHTGELSRMLLDEIDDDHADEEGLIRARVETYHHPVGTCRMGPPVDATAVVDPRARVRGVDALCVIDASIMPAIPSANTNLPTIMLAERCVEWIGR